MMAASFIALINPKPVRHGLQLVNPPITRVVSHPLKGFFMAAHTLNSAIYDTIHQSNEAAR